MKKTVVTRVYICSTCVIVYKGLRKTELKTNVEIRFPRWLKVHTRPSKDFKDSDRTYLGHYWLPGFLFVKNKKKKKFHPPRCTWFTFRDLTVLNLKRSFCVTTVISRPWLPSLLFRCLVSQCSSLPKNDASSRGKQCFEKILLRKLIFLQRLCT